MLVTLETSQDPISAFKEVALLNINDISDTAERSGTSVAGMVKLTQFLNAIDIVAHSMAPHCSMVNNF